MLRTAASSLQSTVRGVLFQNVIRSTAVSTRSMSSHGPVETDEEFDARYEAYFNRPEIDGWEVRKAMNDLSGMDLVPDPKIINAALRACRRINDYAIAVRFLEVIKLKCGDHVDKIYPYVIQEIQPTLDELGIDTPEALGYDKPELYLVDVDDIH